MASSKAAPASGNAGKGAPPPNYTMTPNVLFANLRLWGEAELKVFLVIVRDTMGWHRIFTNEKQLPMTFDRLMEETGLKSRSSVSAAITSLLAAGWIAREKRVIGGKSTYVYWIQIEEEPITDQPAPAPALSPDSVLNAVQNLDSMAFTVPALSPDSVPERVHDLDSMTAELTHQDAAVAPPKERVKERISDRTDGRTDRAIPAELPRRSSLNGQMSDPSIAWYATYRDHIPIAPEGRVPFGIAPLRALEARLAKPLTAQDRIALYRLYLGAEERHPGQGFAWLSCAIFDIIESLRGEEQLTSGVRRIITIMTRWHQQNNYGSGLTPPVQAAVPASYIPDSTKPSGLYFAAYPHLLTTLPPHKIATMVDAFDRHVTDLGHWQHAIEDARSWQHPENLGNMLDRYHKRVAGVATPGSRQRAVAPPSTLTPTPAAVAMTQVRAPEETLTSATHIWHTFLQTTVTQPSSGAWQHNVEVKDVEQTDGAACVILRVPTRRVKEHALEHIDELREHFNRSGYTDVRVVVAVQ